MNRHPSDPIESGVRIAKLPESTRDSPADITLTDSGHVTAGGY